MNQMMLLAETEMRTTLNYGRKNDMNPEPPNPGYNSGHNLDDFWDAWR